MAMTTTYLTVNGKIRSEQRSGEAHSRDYVLDPLGSVIQIYQNGWPIADSCYEPYGGIYTQWNMEGKTFTWLGGWGYRQTGVEWSSVYVRARHYSRGLSNWTSIDPLWPSEMAYGYVEGRVMTRVDPSGMHPCDDRTKGYCEAASRANHGDFGLNCFCFVSDQICKFIKGQITIDGNALISAAVLKKLGVNPILFMKSCQPWAECVNKCLYDCVALGIGCGPGTSSLTARNGLIGRTPRADSPCLYVGCSPTSDSQRTKCCEDRVTLEQTQLGNCVGKGGACNGLDKVVSGVVQSAVVFKGVPATVTLSSKTSQKCSEIFEAVANASGKSFRFSGNNAQRISDAKKNCCSRSTAVWNSSK